MEEKNDNFVFPGQISMFDKTKKDVEDLKDIQKKVKIGNTIEAEYGGKIIKGKVTNFIGTSSLVFNISYDNGLKQATIGKSAVIRILK